MTEPNHDERIDFDGLFLVPNEAAPGDVDDNQPGPSQRLLKAFARGEVTEGGMAEAGWRFLGHIKGDQPKQGCDQQFSGTSITTEPT